MKVSRRERWATSGKAKTVAVDSFALLNRIRISMKHLGIRTGSGAKHLGIILGLGAKTKEGRVKESRRVANAAKRVSVTKLGRRLGTHIFNTGLRLAVLYGASVAAPRMRTVLAMCRAAGRTIGKERGRSLTARLVVNSCDPGWDALHASIMAWVKAAWGDKVPCGVIETA